MRLIYESFQLQCSFITILLLNISLGIIRDDTVLGK